MSTVSCDSDVQNLSNDLCELKEQLKKLKQSEANYAAELASYRSLYLKMEKYYKQLPSLKKKSASGKRIFEGLQVIRRARPVQPNILLRLLLGNHLIYQLVTSSDKFGYKKDYESFKIVATIGHFILSLVGIFFLNNYLFDGFIAFYSAVAYWIMIGRESVLKMNGSNIRGWWFAHHILSMLMSAAMIIWNKETEGYLQVRPALFYFYLFIGGVQILQYKYQMKRLYALRSLSRIDPMETTNELSQNTIHHNLLFLLPFLVISYITEFYLSYLIWKIPQRSYSSRIISLIYLALAVGNTATTCYTYYRKIVTMRREKDATMMRGGSEKKNLLIRKFSQSTDNLNNLNKSE